MPKVNQYCMKHVSASGLECSCYCGATCVVSVVQNTVGTLKSFVSHHKYASVTCYRNCTLEGFSPFLRQHKISYSYIVLNEATGSLLVFVRHSLIFNIGLWWEIGERSSEKGTFWLTLHALKSLFFTYQCFDCQGSWEVLASPHNLSSDWGKCHRSRFSTCLLACWRFCSQSPIW